MFPPDNRRGNKIEVTRDYAVSGTGFCLGALTVGGTGINLAMWNLPFSETTQSHRAEGLVEKSSTGLR
jgi:hypothetical protein